MEKGWVFKIYTRSGLGFKYRLQFDNMVVIIDGDYYYSDNKGYIFLKITNDCYENKIVKIDEWKFVRMYVDEVITGTSAKKRLQFIQIINDTTNGEFDLILTREVARFARNTVDTLQYTRELKSKGGEVYFINDNIKIFDGD